MPMPLSLVSDCGATTKTSNCEHLFLTDLPGSICSAQLGGPQNKPLLVAKGNLTGIGYAEITRKEFLIRLAAHQQLDENPLRTCALCQGNERI